MRKISFAELQLRWVLGEPPLQEDLFVHHYRCGVDTYCRLDDGYYYWNTLDGEWELLEYPDELLNAFCVKSPDITYYIKENHEPSERQLDSSMR